MVEVLEIFLAEPSFLIREGIKTLFSQMGLAYRIEETDAALTNLTKTMKRIKPRLAFINPELLQGAHTFNRTDEAFDQVILIAIRKTNLEQQIAAQFDFNLDICLSRVELTSILDQILLKAKWKNSENDSQSLSDRESDILRSVALGLTNNEIAEKLFISVHTVMTHRKNITRKLGIKTVSGLTVYAILNKLMKAEEVKGRL